MATNAMRMDGMTMGASGRTGTTIAEHNQALFMTQIRARRGPTPEVHFAKHLDNSRLVKQEDPKRAREMRLFSAAITVLFSLLMVYGLQHFQAIMAGYHIEEAKQHREILREENRQLRLTEAKLRDPGRLDRMARELGLEAPHPGQVVRPDQPMNSGDAVLAMVEQPKPATR
jgi:cell division protein FtsL